MTRIALTDIPASAQQSLESLVTWGLCVLQYLYPDAKAVEAVDSNGGPVKVRSVTANTFLNDSVDPSEQRFVGRLSAPVVPDRVFGTPWGNVKNLGDSSVPEGFKR